MLPPDRSSSARAVGDRLRVAMFCGGRGASTITRAFLGRPDVSLSLLVNGYDDGLSTGRIRALVPGCLGPADFRKNFALLLEHTPLAPLGDLLQRRLPSGARPSDVARLVLLERDAGRDAGWDLLEGWLADARSFGAHVSPDTELGDCALGNVLLAGAYLRHGSFNRALRHFIPAGVLGAELLNVDGGEDRWLAALQADGTLLASEAAIVAPRGASTIAQLYLLPQPLVGPRLRELERLPLAERARALAEMARPARIAAEAADALRRADLIVFGPGTQHSSLLPSYRAVGLAAALDSARAPRLLVLNLDEDNDIRGLGGEEIVALALSALGPASNGGPLVTHVLRDVRTAGLPRGLRSFSRSGEAGASLPPFIDGDFASRGAPERHDGERVAAAALALVAREAAPSFALPSSIALPGGVE